MRDLFTGRNIYSPNVRLEGGVYKMWYGGWQTDAEANTVDRIYYRTSTDNTTWSAPTTVLQPAQVSKPDSLINDPSVTRTTGTTHPYTMFYTNCVNRPCISDNQQIWSSVSNDGVNWTGHKALLAGWPGPSEPSAIVESGPNDQRWKVYYVDRNECRIVKAVTVNSARNPIAVSRVFTSPTTDCLANPEVTFFNGVWHLFVNRWEWNPFQGNILEAESMSNMAWSTAELRIGNPGPHYCATVGPGVLPAGGADYHLYFGLAARASSGNCDLTQFRRMARWRWRDD